MIFQIILTKDWGDLFEHFKDSKEYSQSNRKIQNYIWTFHLMPSEFTPLTPVLSAANKQLVEIKNWLNTESHKRVSHQTSKLVSQSVSYNF